jgi:hypothetical protein
LLKAFFRPKSDCQKRPLRCNSTKRGHMTCHWLMLLFMLSSFCTLNAVSTFSTLVHFLSILMAISWFQIRIFSIKYLDLGDSWVDVDVKLSFYGIFKISLHLNLEIWFASKWKQILLVSIDRSSFRPILTI